MSIYAQPIQVSNLKDCFFYHTVDLPGLGTIEGHWDLRKNINDYLGHYKFKNKRVLEMGTADGMLCFEMEKRGAEVVALDLSPDLEWDLIPYAQYDYKILIQERKDLTRRLNNAFWFSHKLLNSKAKMVYAPIYNVPREIGQVDIITFGAILLHLQNPFGALRQAADLSREAVIVTDLHFLPNINEPRLLFLPNHENLEYKDMWWYMTPELIIKMLGVLGFEKSSVVIHKQKHFGQEKNLFTVVAKRPK